MLDSLSLSNQFIYLHCPTVTELAFLHKAVPADWRSHHAVVVWFIQQAARAAACQVSLVVVAAAATESPRNVPAKDTNSTLSLLTPNSHSLKHIFLGFQLLLHLVLQQIHKNKPGIELPIFWLVDNPVCHRATTAA